MPPHEEPKNAAASQEPELDSTDGGWDPYVAALLMSGGQPGSTVTDDDGDGPPVMSLSRTPASRSGK